MRADIPAFIPRFLKPATPTPVTPALNVSAPSTIVTDTSTDPGDASRKTARDIELKTLRVDEKFEIWRREFLDRGGIRADFCEKYKIDRATLLWCDMQFIPTPADIVAALDKFILEGTFKIEFDEEPDAELPSEDEGTEELLEEIDRIAVVCALRHNPVEISTIVSKLGSCKLFEPGRILTGSPLRDKFAEIVSHPATLKFLGATLDSPRIMMPEISEYQLRRYASFVAEDKTDVHKSLVNFTDVDLAKIWRVSSYVEFPTQAAFCKKYNLNRGNFGSWLNAKRKSPASRTAVISWIGARTLIVRHSAKELVSMKRMLGDPSRKNDDPEREVEGMLVKIYRCARIMVISNDPPSPKISIKDLIGRVRAAMTPAEKESISNLSIFISHLSTLRFLGAIKKDETFQMGGLPRFNFEIDPKELVPYGPS